MFQVRNSLTVLKVAAVQRYFTNVSVTRSEFLKSSQWNLTDIRLLTLTYLLHIIHHMFVYLMWSKWDPCLQTRDLLLPDTSLITKESTPAPNSSALRQSPSTYSPLALSLNSLYISMPLAFMAYCWKSITVVLHKNKTWWGVSVVASTSSGCDGDGVQAWLPQTAQVYNHKIHCKWQTINFLLPRPTATRIQYGTSAWGASVW